MLLCLTQWPILNDNPTILINSGYVQNAPTLSCVRLVGYQLSANGSGTVQIRTPKDDIFKPGSQYPSSSQILETITFPGIAEMPSDLNWGPVGPPGQGVEIAVQTPGLQVTGRVSFRVEPIWRAFTKGMPVGGLLLSLTRP